MSIAPITDADVGTVAAFLQVNLNSKVAASAWRRAVDVPWRVAQPNHGFMLVEAGRVVGAYLAYYSERVVAGRVLQVCNLGAWCVLDSHRHNGLRLLMRLLGQKGYEFTDFSPSGNVVALNRKLRFTDLDTTTALVPALPVPVRGVRVTSDADEIAATLRGDVRALYLDHRDTAAARHLLLRTRDDHCYVVARRDTRKGVRAFASVLYASDPEMFRRHAPRVAGHLLTRHGAAATLVEHRVAGGRPTGAVTLSASRPKMIKSDLLDPDRVDYLYSELTCLEW